MSDYGINYRNAHPNHRWTLVVRRHMRSKALQYKDIAERTSLTVDRIEYLVNGRRQARLNDVEVICRALGFPVDQAFDPIEQEKPITHTPEPFHGCLDSILNLLSARGWTRKDLVQAIPEGKAGIARNLSRARSFNIPQLEAVCRALNIELQELASKPYDDSLVRLDPLDPPALPAEDKVIAFSDGTIKSGRIRQIDLAEQMGIVPHTIMAWRAKRARIKVPIFLSLCNALGVEPTEVVA